VSERRERILVLGASGGCGAHVVRHAVARGHAVAAMIRPATAARMAAAPDGATVIADEPLRDGAIAEAIRGHRADVVVSCVGVRRRRPRNPWSGLLSPPDLVERTAALVVDAMRATGVGRVLQISAAGVADSAPRMNWVMRFLVARSKIGVAYRDLARAEAVLAASELDWTAVRPVTLSNGRAKRTRDVDRFGVVATIPREAVAVWLLDHLGPTVGASRTPMIAA
jgi:putative NADH-flavin reductase